MIVSGWLELISDGENTLSVDWTPEIGGISVLAVVTLTAYTQGFSSDFAGGVAGYIRGYTPAGGQFVPIPGDPKNNAYYINECQSVQFRLAGNLVRAYAHAAAYQLGGVGGFKPIDHHHRNFEISVGDRSIGRHRVSSLTSGSRMNVDEVLAQWRAQLAAHHGLSADALILSEVPGSGGTGSTGMVLP